MGDVGGSSWFGSVYSDVVSYESGIALELEDSTSSGYKFKFNAQLTHKYDEGKDIEFHLHLGTSGTGTGNVKIKMTYQWANTESAFPASTSVTKTFAIDGTDKKHQMEEIAASISGTSKTISSIILCTVERVADGDDTYSGSIYVIGLDYHVPLNMVGSRTATSK